MKKMVMAVALCAIVPGMVREASAQEPGKVGLSIQGPTSVGFVFKVGESVAVRPEFGMTRSSTESASAVDIKRTTTTVSPGISVLFYAKEWDTTRLYVSPRYLYSRATASDNGKKSSGGTVHSLSGSLGVEHELGRRFSVFGEAGLAWSTSESTSSTGSLVSKGKGLTTRGSVGVAFFF